MTRRHLARRTAPTFFRARFRAAIQPARPGSRSDPPPVDGSSRSRQVSAGVCSRQDLQRRNAVGWLNKNSARTSLSSGGSSCSLTFASARHCVGIKPFDGGSISTTGATQVPSQETRVELLSSNNDGATAVPRRRAVTKPVNDGFVRAVRMTRALSRSSQRLVQSSPSGAVPAATRLTRAPSHSGSRSDGGTGGTGAGGGATGELVAVCGGWGVGLLRTQADITRDVASTTANRVTHPYYRC